MLFVWTTHVHHNAWPLFVPDKTTISSSKYTEKLIKIFYWICVIHSFQTKFGCNIFKTNTNSTPKLCKWSFAKIPAVYSFVSSLDIHLIRTTLIISSNGPNLGRIKPFTSNLENGNGECAPEKETIPKLTGNKRNRLSGKLRVLTNNKLYLFSSSKVQYFEYILTRACTSFHHPSPKLWIMINTIRSVFLIYFHLTLRRMNSQTYSETRCSKSYTV